MDPFPRLAGQRLQRLHEESQVAIDSIHFLRRLMYLKQRIFGFVIMLISIGMIYWGWHELRTEGEYSLRMAAFSPLIGVGGVFLMLFPTMGGKQGTTKGKLIVMLVLAVGVIAGLLNWFLMDPGFFGF
jgi:hypothetical protein